jgi:hypothetical protein
MVDGSGDCFGPSSCFGKVDGGNLLCPQCSLASVQFNQLAVEGYWLTSKLIVVLSYPPLGVDLSGAGSCFLLLLVSLLFIEEELHP